MSSVRFICGTQDLHKELEAAISRFFKTDVCHPRMPLASMPTAVFFEPLLTAEDAIISDALNHASIIDAYASAKPSVIAMPMPIWRISSANCRPHKNSVSALW